MRVRKGDRHRERAEGDVAKLDAKQRNDIAETEVVFAKELWEIIKKDNEESDGAAIQITRCELEISFFQERSQKLEEGKKELVERRPALTGKVKRSSSKIEGQISPHGYRIVAILA
jgi:hypothetical protein